MTVSSKTHLSAGASYGGPLGAAVTAELVCGLGADVREEDERIRGVAGLLVQVHAGSRGGKLSLGVGGDVRIDSDDWGGTVATSVKLSLARTWASAPAENGRTYFGPEIDLSVRHVAVSVGTLWRVRGVAGPRLLLSWGLGVRL